MPRTTGHHWCCDLTCSYTYASLFMSTFSFHEVLLLLIIKINPQQEQDPSLNGHYGCHYSDSTTTVIQTLSSV